MPPSRRIVSGFQLRASTRTPPALLLVLLAALAVVRLSAGTRPNIVFILCDDLGYGATGPTFQNERAARGDRSRPSFATPALDRFAGEGVQLRRHYAGAPICVASRASLLLGLTQGHSPIRDNRFDEALPDRPTLASVLRLAGYATVAVGKWGLQGGGKGGEEDEGRVAERVGLRHRRTTCANRGGGRGQRHEGETRLAGGLAGLSHKTGF